MTVLTEKLTEKRTEKLTHQLTDSLTMTQRGLAHWARRPGQLIAGLVFPVLILVMFVAFLGGGMSVPDGSDYTDHLVPGMLALTMVFGLETTMVALTQDITKGVLDRFRSMPLAPSSILAGRAALDMLHSLAALAVMTAAGLALGWRWHGSPAEAAAAFALLLWLRLAMLWAGIWLGLVAGRPELVQAVQILVWPVAFLSNVFTSPDTMPAWLGAAAEWNPLSATAGAVRGLLSSGGWDSGSWAAGHATLLAVVWPLLLLAVFVPAALRRFAALGR
ncbi:ABC transporter permease [Streptomyces sp. 7-21]|uniref:ABC transporter permease n=1 Tax=Streptomyces sp. 7-21 TaxID=2802283 RepID=UPI00191ED921|nr:ABC transporter permease [Streptomyces sp. 7-21]MBL1067604.1 ABC transporter permease [Streptomyces sp. 7-21]